MAGVPPAPTVAVAGQPTQASNQFNRLADRVAFLLAPPLAILRQTVAQSIPNNAMTALLFDTEDLDREGGHSTSSNTSRYTAQTAGYYEVSGAVGFTGNATGSRLAQINVNGTGQNGTEVGWGTVPNSGHLEIVVPSTMVYLNVGDYVELAAFQSSGGALNTFLSGVIQARMNVRWVST